MTMLNEQDKTINGLSYEVKGAAKGVRPRVIVQGVFHPAGVLPIRFKSLDRAVRHIVNMKLKAPGFAG
jgi:hypothetical protein